MKGVTQIADATCLACGCLCDDITLSVAGDRVLKAEKACPIGETWFLADRAVDLPACHIVGEPASAEAGYVRAGEILGGTKYPLFLGLNGLTCEAQRVVVSLADWLHGCVGATGAGESALDAAVKSVGMVTATLGEVRHRADLVVFWHIDPATTHPRHFERYSLEPRGEFVPNGRKDRRCIVVGPAGTATAAMADLAIESESPGEAGALSEDMPFVKGARYIAVFSDAKLVDESLLTFVGDLNRKKRCVCIPIGEPGNAAGAKQLLAWQAGRTGLVDFSTGVPRAADKLLSSDAAILFACDPAADAIGGLPAELQKHIVRIPHIVIHTADVAPPENASVSFVVATAGIHSAGTVFRCDGVPLPLRPGIESLYPTAEDVLKAIAERLPPVANKSLSE
jgi:formylmethanofuran dehydrogenase subunit B